MHEWADASSTWRSLLLAFQAPEPIPLVQRLDYEVSGACQDHLGKVDLAHVGPRCSRPATFSTAPRSITSIARPAILMLVDDQFLTEPLPRPAINEVDLIDVVTSA